MASFAVMALNVLIWQVEMLLAGLMMLTLLPTLAFRSFAWIGQGSLGLVINLSFRFGLGALLSSLSFPVLDRLTITTPVSFQSVIVSVIGGWCFAFLFWQCNKLASAMLSGIASLTAGSVAGAAVGSAVAAGALLSGAAALGGGALAAGGGVLRGAMAARGAGSAAAGTLASGGGSGMASSPGAGALRSPQWRQSESWDAALATPGELCGRGRAGRGPAGESQSAELCRCGALYWPGSRRPRGPSLRRERGMPRWLGQLGWCGVWIIALYVVRGWGMWWYVGAAGGLTTACWWLLVRVVQGLWTGAVALRQPPPRRVRRLVIEERIYD